jgi:hypothetical protein
VMRDISASVRAEECRPSRLRGMQM